MGLFAPVSSKGKPCLLSVSIHIHANTAGQLRVTRASVAIPVTSAVPRRSDRHGCASRDQRALNAASAPSCAVPKRVADRVQTRCAAVIPNHAADAVHASGSGAVVEGRTAHGHVSMKTGTNAQAHSPGGSQRGPRVRSQGRLRTGSPTTECGRPSCSFADSSARNAGGPRSTRPAGEFHCTSTTSQATDKETDRTRCDCFAPTATR